MNKYINAEVAGLYACYFCVKFVVWYNPLCRPSIFLDGMEVGTIAVDGLRYCSMQICLFVRQELCFELGREPEGRNNIT